MTSPEELLETIDAIVYGDLFDCAVTFDEAWRYSRTRISREDLRNLLHGPDLAGTITESEGHYCLAGRERLLGLRSVARDRADRLRRRAHRISRLLRHAPFVRGLLLTGSVAAGNAESHADVDFLVVVAPHRLSTVFLLFGSVSRLMSRRLLCPNYYLSEDHLALTRRTFYVAREVVQAVPLTASGTGLLAANPWTAKLLPNGPPQEVHADAPKGRSFLQSGIEFFLGGRTGDRLEAWARTLAHRRLQAHYALHDGKVPDAVRDGLDSGRELRFHANPANQSIHDRYIARRAEVADSLHRARSRALSRTA